MAIIETEIWKPNPDRPGTIIFDSHRVAQDIFNELKTHLIADGRMPDEYFMLDSQWEDGKLFPKDVEILINTNYGGSEGVYIDVALMYKKEVYERNPDGVTLGWVKRTVREHFITGKTLGQTIDDLDKMNLVASSVMAAFYGMEREIKERYTKIANGEMKPVYPLSSDELNEAGKLLRQNTNELPSTKVVNGEISCFDLVISTGDSTHPFLAGVVNAVDKIGSEEHHSGNPHDDVFVDFQSDEYSAQRIKEIEKHFSKFYGEPKTFDDIQYELSNMAISPDNLIRVETESDLKSFLESRQSAEEYCNKILGVASEPTKPAKPAEKPKSFEDKLKSAQVKADAHNAQKNNSLNKKGENEL